MLVGKVPPDIPSGHSLLCHTSPLQALSIFDPWHLEMSAPGATLIYLPRFFLQDVPSMQFIMLAEAGFSLFVYVELSLELSIRFSTTLGQFIVPVILVSPWLNVTFLPLKCLGV